MTFMDFIPKDIFTRRPTNMTGIDTNRKRPAPTYNDFDASKRRQQATTTTNDDGGLFISEDETDDNTPRARNFLDHATSEGSFSMLIDQNRPERAQPRSRAPNTTAPNNGHLNGNASQSISHTNNTTATQPTSKTQQSTTPRHSSSNRLLRATTTDIKDETHPEPAHLHDLPREEKIKLYVGKRNRQIFVKRADLAKSPVLTSYITHDPHALTSTANADPSDLESSDTYDYIMTPRLLKLNVDDFEAVCQFLHSGEYAPLLISDQNGEKVLDGMQTDESYSDQLVRNARIYVLGQTFKVEGLEDLIYRKITLVNKNKYSIRSLVEVAAVVFADKRGSPTSQPGSTTSNPFSSGQGSMDSVAANGAVRSTSTPVVGGKDKLEEWVISQIAANFSEIVTTQHVAFFALREKTKKRMFYARVLEEEAERYRATGGNLPGAFVELD